MQKTVGNDDKMQKQIEQEMKKIEIYLVFPL